MSARPQNNLFIKSRTISTSAVSGAAVLHRHAENLNSYHQTKQERM